MSLGPKNVLKYSLKNYCVVREDLVFIVELAYTFVVEFKVDNYIWRQREKKLILGAFSVLGVMLMIY